MWGVDGSQPVRLLLIQTDSECAQGVCFHTECHHRPALRCHLFTHNNATVNLAEECQVLIFQTLFFFSLTFPNVSKQFLSGRKRRMGQKWSHFLLYFIPFANVCNLPFSSSVFDTEATYLSQQMAFKIVNDALDWSSLTFNGVDMLGLDTIWLIWFAQLMILGVWPDFKLVSADYFSKLVIVSGPLLLMYKIIEWWSFNICGKPHSSLLSK